MKHTILFTMFAAVVASTASGADRNIGDFNTIFADSTLRVDYIFGGSIDKNGRPECHIFVDELSRMPGWAGRRHNLAELPLAGNGRITMTDSATGDTIYRTSFSTLFQEWISDGKEAQEVARSFQNVFLLPMPRRAAMIEVELSDSRHQRMGSLVHNVDPEDILIRDRGEVKPLDHRYIHRGGDPREVIDVAILAEGYTEAEADSFYSHAAAAVEAIASHEPFKSRMDDFNFVAVAAPSAESGVSVPRLGDWKSTAVGSHFSTFYSDRYLTTPDNRSIHDCLQGIPYEHIIILANTDEYGGGGIYNLYTLTTARHSQFKPVVVHEFGHSFGGLADEYFYENDPTTTAIYPLDIEPWEPNITTLVDFASKWQALLNPGTPVPTPDDKAGKYPTGLYEGGGYVARGVYRPAYECRMKVNTCDGFCEACQAWLNDLIDFYTDK